MNLQLLRRTTVYTAPPATLHQPIQWQKYLRWFRRYADGIIATSGLFIIIFLVIFAGQVTPYDPTAGMNLQERFIPPFWAEGGTITHPLGTDNFGRDVLARTLHGGQVSIRVALIAGTISTVIGMAYGLISGYCGGWIDRIMLRLTDVWVSFPFLVLALAVIAAVGNSPLILIALLSLAAWVHPARVTRVETLKVRHQEYVDASSAIGASPYYIIRHHIIPNVLPYNIVMWTFSVGTLILIEGSLSFLGLGVSPPTPSWGNMLSDGRTYLQDAWWQSVFPGLALMLTVLCVNALGDFLQKWHSHGKLG